MPGLAFSSFPVTEVKNLRFMCSQPALHKHPFYQIFVLCQGSGTHSLDGDTGPVQAPIVLVAPPERQHLFVPSTDADGWSLGFTEGLLSSGGSLLFLNTVTHLGIPLSRPEVADRLCDLARMIHENHCDPKGGDPLVQSHLLAAFLQILQREQRSRTAGARPEPLADRRLSERFLRLLDQACQGRWDGARFARELRCSRRKLLAICQQNLGLPLHAALEEHRMRQARAMLAESGTCIQTIALELGYPDPSYFAKAFRRVMGVTPTDYRNARLGQAAPAPGQGPGATGKDQPAL